MHLIAQNRVLINRFHDLERKVTRMGGRETHSADPRHPPDRGQQPREVQPGIGRVAGLAGLTLAVGHSRNGVLLSPVTGRLVSELVQGKDPGPEAAALDPARWELA